jgi:hypothetical protein
MNLALNLTHSAALRPNRRALICGETQMSYAELEAAGKAPVVRIRYRKPQDKRSRPQRWRDAVAELVDLQADYAAWLDALPASLRDSATADALRAICDFDRWLTRCHAPGAAVRTMRPARRNRGSVVRRKVRITGPIPRRSISHRQLPGSGAPCMCKKTL